MNNEISVNYLLKEESYSNLKEIREMLLKVKNSSNEIVIDEVDLNENFINFLFYVKYSGLTITLKTKKLKNSDNYKYIDKVLLELNSTNNDILEKYRNSDNFILEIETTVDEKNIDEIKKIGLLVKEIKPSKWSLIKSENISDEEFNNTINKITNLDFLTKKEFIPTLKIKKFVKNKTMLLQAQY